MSGLIKYPHPSYLDNDLAPQISENSLTELNIIFMWPKLGEHIGWTRITGIATIS
jgi:hypothetical protein